MPFPSSSPFQRLPTSVPSVSSVVKVVVVVAAAPLLPETDVAA